MNSIACAYCGTAVGPFGVTLANGGRAHGLCVDAARPAAKTTRVRVTLTVDVDLDAYRSAYGDESVEEVRDSVRHAVADGAQFALESGITRIRLAD